MAESEKIANALTIDVEDWIQSVFDVDAPLADCFVCNTHTLLNLLSVHNVRATFFVLGLAAEKAPDLVRAIHAAGHEVQSHGYGHRLIHTQTTAEFREDVRKSKLLLEDLIGESITGYRAPAFSITRATLWALDELVDLGFRYDSSIFPVRMRRYGIGGLPREPFRILTPGGNSLLEFPVCSLKLDPFTLPAGGGGYFRTGPYWYTRAAIRQANRSGRPAALYLHPYELAPGEFDELPVPIPFCTRLQQGLGRSSVAAKLNRLLSEFRFTTMGELIPSASHTLPLHTFGAVDSCQTPARPVFIPA